MKKDTEVKKKKMKSNPTTQSFVHHLSATEKVHYYNAQQATGIYIMTPQKRANNSKGVNQTFENPRPKLVKHHEDNINPARQKINEII